jgi:hypothetical protein
LKIVPNPSRFNLETFQILAIKHFGEPLRDAPKKTVQDMRNFILVLPRRYQKRYAQFFDEVEVLRDSLGIISYGAQSVSLSDIFVKICETVGVDKDAPDVYVRKGDDNNWESTMDGEWKTFCGGIFGLYFP